MSFAPARATTASSSTSSRQSARSVRPSPDHRRRITLEGRDVWLISPEDLILLKAFSDRERDFEDLVTLYRHSGSKLDKPYIEKWARSLDESIGSDEVTERIKRAQRRSLKK